MSGNSLEIEKKFVKILKEHTETELNENALMEIESLEQIGVNSFKAIQILIDLEVELDIEISDELITPEMFVSPSNMLKSLKQVIDSDN